MCIDSVLRVLKTSQSCPRGQSYVFESRIVGRTTVFSANKSSKNIELDFWIFMSNKTSSKKIDFHLFLINILWYEWIIVCTLTISWNLASFWTKRKETHVLCKFRIYLFARQQTLSVRNQQMVPDNHQRHYCYWSETKVI